MRGQEQLRGMYQPTLLARVDRGGAAAERRIAAIAHLDEDQGLAVAHHQIELAATEMRIGSQFDQPGRAQQFARRRFDRRSALATIEAQRISVRRSPRPGGRR